MKKGDTFYSLEIAWDLPRGELLKLNKFYDPNLKVNEIPIGYLVRKPINEGGYYSYSNDYSPVSESNYTVNLEKQTMTYKSFNSGAEIMLAWGREVANGGQTILELTVVKMGLGGKSAVTFGGKMGIDLTNQLIIEQGDINKIDFANTLFSGVSNSYLRNFLRSTMDLTLENGFTIKETENIATEFLLRTLTDEALKSIKSKFKIQNGYAMPEDYLKKKARRIVSDYIDDENSTTDN